MELHMTTFLIVCPLVFLAGFVDAIGGGGGLISLPAYYLAGVPIHHAIATNKLSSATGTLISTIRIGKSVKIRWKLIAPAVVMALIGSYLGTRLSILTDEKILRQVLLIVLPVVAFFVLRKNSLISEKTERLEAKKEQLIVWISALIIGTYDENGVPARLDAVVLSTQHDPEVTQDQIHKDIKKYVFDAIIPEGMVDEKTKFFINPTGRFVIGGPHGDAGLTGRKIIVDTYGGMARHGGGAFSGKDCTKVDRSAAYAARYVAKNIVAAGLADKCEIQLSYAIGVAQPTSIMVDTFGTGAVEDDKLVEIVRENFDLRPAGIIQMLDLRRPIYKQTAAYGHFGRTDIDLQWEKLDKVEDLKKYL